MSENDPEIVILPEARAKLDELLAEHPEAREQVAELFANMRQAMRAVNEGRYPSFDDAMLAITGHRPEPVDPGDEPPPICPHCGERHDFHELCE